MTVSVFFLNNETVVTSGLKAMLTSAAIILYVCILDLLSLRSPNMQKKVDVIYIYYHQRTQISMLASLNQ